MTSAKRQVIRAYDHRAIPVRTRASTALDHNFSGSCGFLPAASFSRRHGRSEYQSRMRLPPRHPRTNGSRSRLGPVGSSVTVCSVPVFAVTACFTSCRQLPIYSCAASFVARSSFLPFQLIFERTEPRALRSHGSRGPFCIRRLCADWRNFMAKNDYAVAPSSWIDSLGTTVSIACAIQC